MNKHKHGKTELRCGSAVAEVTIAVVIASVAMVSVVQLLAVTARQNRLVNRRKIATIEVGNLMEDIISRPFEQIAGETPPNVELSEFCRDTIPDARLQLDISPDDGSENVRRVTIRIDWENSVQQRTRPVQLVAWKYRSKEAQP